MPIPPTASYISCPLHQRSITTAYTLHQTKLKILLLRVEVHELPGRAAAERHVRDPGAGQDPQQGTRAQGDRVPEDAQHAQEVGRRKNIYV